MKAMLEGIKRVLNRGSEIEHIVNQIRETTTETHKLVLDNKDAMKEMARRIQCGPPRKKPAINKKPNGRRG